MALTNAEEEGKVSQSGSGWKLEANSRRATVACLARQATCCALWSSSRSHARFGCDQETTNGELEKIRQTANWMSVDVEHAELLRGCVAKACICTIIEARY